MAGLQSSRPSSSAFRALFSYKVFASALFTLLFLATLSAFLSSSSSPPHHFLTFALRRHRFLASDPLRARVDLIYRQAADHSVLATAYAAYARRLKLDSSRQLRIFEGLDASLSDLSLRLAAAGTIVDDEDALRAVEKEAKDRIKFVRQLVGESKEAFDTQIKIQKLRDTIFSVREQLHRAKKLGDFSGSIAAGSTPKSLHCLAMRLMEERIAHPDTNRHAAAGAPSDPELYHCAIFSDNIIAVSVVVNSAINNTKEPWKHVFHVVTDPMYLAAMQVWFFRRPPTGGAKVEVRSVAEFEFLNASYSPVVRMVEGGRRDLSLLHYLRFFLPQMFPKLKRIVLLEDDVVVQKDLAGLWSVDLDGRVNGAVETCFGGFKRYNRYLNFSNPLVRHQFSSRACAWAYGVNVFDLDAWRKERLTERFHEYQSLNEDGTLWDQTSVLPAGLATFYTTTKPLNKTWHVLGLGYNPSVSLDEIQNAAVIHFDGNMKPWLDVALNQYKHLWTKYVDTEMDFLQLCNFGL